MKTIAFLDVELELLQELFKDLSERYQCAGWNEKDIPSTPEMNLLIAIVEKEWYDKEGIPENDRPSQVEITPAGKIRAMDFMILKYFERKLGVKV